MRLINLVLTIISKLLAMFAICTIMIYRLFVSTLLGQGKCRYIPSCSQYAYQAFSQHGLLRALIYTIKRILSCQPFGGYGYDPVPKVPNQIGKQKSQLMKFSLIKYNVEEKK